MKNDIEFSDFKWYIFQSEVVGSMLYRQNIHTNRIYYQSWEFKWVDCTSYMPGILKGIHQISITRACIKMMMDKHEEGARSNG